MSPKLSHLKVQTHSASHASTSHATFEIALATQWKIVSNATFCGTLVWRGRLHVGIPTKITSDTWFYLVQILC